MMRNEMAKCLDDAARAVELIKQFTAGKTCEEYETDAMLRAAVERQFEIAGKALARALRLSPDLAPRLGGAERIIALRDCLSRGLAGVPDEVTWGCVEASLPRLGHDLAAVVKEEAR
jgi:uncharacterized protein with HEPN domain